MKSSCETACAVDRSCGCEALVDTALDAGCTLAPDAIPDRGDAFRDVFNRALLRAERTDAGSAWVFAWSPEVEADARALAAAEGGCCSFFEFEVERRGNELHWRTSVPADKAELLDATDAIARDALLPRSRVSTPDR